MSNFTRQYMSADRAEVLAAYFRTRGRPGAAALNEWHALSEDDREFWLHDVYAVLSRVNIFVGARPEEKAS